MRWIDAFSSWSAKDRADAYLYKLSQTFYETIADGADVETMLAQLDADWRKYATEQNKRLKSVAKFSIGPYQGQSMAMDSYVYPDKFGSMRISLRNMVKILVERFKEV